MATEKPLVPQFGTIYIGYREHTGWEPFRYLNEGKPTDKSAYNFSHSVEMFNEAVRRSKIPNWGLEVVPVELADAR